MSTPTRLSSSINSSYDDEVKMMERMLDRQQQKGGKAPATFTALKFGDDDGEEVIMSTSPASQANDKHMAMRAQRSKEGSSAAQQAASSAAPVAANTPSNNPSAPLSTSPADKPAAAGGDKQKEKQEPKQKHQQEKKEKQEPKQKQQQQQGEKQQGQKEKQQQQQGEKQQQKKQQQQNQGDKQQNIRKSGKDGAAEGGDAPVDPARARKQSVASHTSKPNQFDDPKERQRAQKKQILQLEVATKQVPLFSHLPQYERPKDSITERILTSTQLQGGLQIHPKILRLGIKYANRQLQGANARTIAMLKAFKHVIRDYENTSGKPLAMDLDAKLKPLIQFLIDCRPLAIGMGNAIKNLKRQIGVTMNISNDEESKAYLISEIDRYIQERIVLSAEAIAGTAADKINNGDVILTYASSHSVESTFKQAHSQGKNFQVIVVDSRPRFEGRTLLTRLAAAGIQCSYIMLNAVSFIMKDVDKVFLGAHAMMSNGHAYSRCGTAVVSMMAHSYAVPVLVLCETYKFADRVQVDAISQNELDDPDDLVPVGGVDHILKDWKSKDRLKLLNLVYDLTPMDFISMVVTEVGVIPPTSVPVIIREAQLRSQEQVAPDRSIF